MFNRSPSHWYRFIKEAALLFVKDRKFAFVQFMKQLSMKIVEAFAPLTVRIGAAFV